MKILVTGAGGFVGAPLLRRLADAGHAVTGVDNTCADRRSERFDLVVGDIASEAILGALSQERWDAVVHLATVPGGAAEQSPTAAMRTNVDASLALMAAVADRGRPRVIFASSIAVFGATAPDVADDDRAPTPVMLYGAHKAMVECWIATQSRRNAIDGVSLRFPGLVARPMSASGLKSAFMSDVFHAMRLNTPFVAPVSAQADLWLMSIPRVLDNIVHALEIDTALLPRSRAVTLPPACVNFGALVEELARATSTVPARISYAPDEALEALFGRYPPLRTPVADELGFSSDGSVSGLVETVLSTLEPLS